MVRRDRDDGRVVYGPPRSAETHRFGIDSNFGTERSLTNANMTLGVDSDDILHVASLENDALVDLVSRRHGIRQRSIPRVERAP